MSGSQQSEGEAPVRMIIGLIWVMLGSGLTLLLASDTPAVRQVGQVLITIAVLWRLLLYLRALRPSAERINAAQAIIAEKVLGDLTVSAPAQVTPRDQSGRTPVERLLADDE